jgi:excisionase family DNA binding protein
MKRAAVISIAKDWWREERKVVSGERVTRAVFPSDIPLEGVARFSTVKQVADLFGVSIHTVYEWVRSKRLRAIPLGTRCYRISRDDLRLFLATEQMQHKLG